MSVSANMGAETQHLHVALFPLLAHGHMIPTLDVARLFAARGVRATIITTPLNAPAFTEAIEKGERTGPHGVDIEVFDFPAQQVGLAPGCESLDKTHLAPDPMGKFFQAVSMLRGPLESYLERTRPDCLVADMFFPWATEAAARFGIPRLVFHGIGFFALCAQEIMRLHEPHKSVASYDEQFLLPYLPHQVKLTRLQISDSLRKGEETEFGRFFNLTKESELKSYGVIVNSFYELEPDYAVYFTRELGRRAWHVGPVSLCSRSLGAKAHRGKPASMDEHECLKWLDSKEPDSVVYVCFGSTVRFIAPQLREIAVALEASEQEFIWVVRDCDGGEREECWLPPGFEQKVGGRGLIIRGWAPQVLILEHQAVGAFLTHCGWNSTMEGVSAGVPMVTWPIFAEQFFNEKLVVEILKTGVPVGAKKWIRAPSEEDVIEHDAIEKAIREAMGGEGADGRRSRAEKLKHLARKAVEAGGSSYNDLTSLIDELRVHHS